MYKKAKYIYLALAVLAVAQLGWWAYLVISQQEALAALDPSSSAVEKLKHFKVMILSESTFAMIVWTIGVWLAYRAFDQQIQLREIQSNFISAVTHELKTPIANIQLCLDTLQRKDLSPEQQKKYFVRSQDSISILQEEVDKILTLHPSKHLSLSLEKISLKQTISSLIKPLEEKYQVSVNSRFFGPIKDVEVWAPQHESRLILNSILDNAIKYTVADRSQKKVDLEVRLNQDKKFAVAEIIDHGMGMEKTDFDQAFDSFWRSKKSTEKAIPGSGIGLTLARELGKQYRIQIDLKPNEYNGVTVQTTWPLTKT